MMPRYPLILRDETYITLFQHSAQNGKSLGKYINELLDREAEYIKNGKEMKPKNEIHKCCVCGSVKVNVVGWKGEQSFFYCREHRPSLRHNIVCANSLDGWREISESKLL